MWAVPNAAFSLTEILGDAPPRVRFGRPRRQRGGQPFERADDGQELLGVRPRKGRHRQPSLVGAGFSPDVPLLLQPAERLPDRRPADAEPPGDIGLDQATTRREPAAHDELTQPLIRLLRLVHVPRQDHIRHRSSP